ncbi:hypothetical protein AO441_002569 [Nakaseomyces glabratus]|uniref:Uncharacterized protein n=1 Tax=Candida glabrata TaxID=5478 RepID=A0A0W0E113_CANGB|nr:hypothetical protein AO439_002742 [Nakaseomyces glabratus]KTB00147.1 hypothetical protein AO441_002569 [Nakaseomyces glabratus]KTB05142.1 hypothetical protein AO440_002666 [Nakaseomyces glabratus]KTB17713.1 hypothetical protein AO438_002745 [Nakaseomyces glabratus]
MESIIENDTIEQDSLDSIELRVPQLEDYSIHTYENSSDGTTSYSDGSELSSSSSKVSFRDKVRQIFKKTPKTDANEEHDEQSNSSFSFFRVHRKKKCPEENELESSNDSEKLDNLQPNDTIDGYSNRENIMMQNGSKSPNNDHSVEANDSTGLLLAKSIDNIEDYSDYENDADIFDSNDQGKPEISPLTPAEFNNDLGKYKGVYDFSEFFYEVWQLITNDGITLESIGNQKPKDYLLESIRQLMTENNKLKVGMEEFEEELLQKNTELQKAKKTYKDKLKKSEDKYKTIIKKYIAELKIMTDDKNNTACKELIDFDSMNQALKQRIAILESESNDLDTRNKALTEKLEKMTEKVGEVSRQLITMQEANERFKESLDDSTTKIERASFEIDRSCTAINHLKQKYEYQKKKTLTLLKRDKTQRKMAEFFETYMRESLSFVGYLLEAFKGKFNETDYNELQNYYLDISKITELKGDLRDAENVDSRIHSLEEMIFNFYSVAAKAQFVEPILVRQDTAERSVTFLTGQLESLKKELQETKKIIKQMKKASSNSSHDVNKSQRRLTNKTHTEILADLPI